MAHRLACLMLCFSLAACSSVQKRAGGDARGASADYAYSPAATRPATQSYLWYPGYSQSYTISNGSDAALVSAMMASSIFGWYAYRHAEIQSQERRRMRSDSAISLQLWEILNAPLVPSLTETERKIAPYAATMETVFVAGTFALLLAKAAGWIK